MARLRPLEEERAIRDDVFRWLDTAQLRGQYEFSREELINYHYFGERIPLLDTGRGIRNPVTFRATLSVMTGAKRNQYADEVLDDGSVVYSLADNNSPDNVKLKIAFETKSEFVYFKSDRDGFYVAYYPMRITHFDEAQGQILMTEELSSDFGTDPLELAVDQRRYAVRTTKARLHQRHFRARVLSAYSDTCSVCRLRYPQLLDAAHITSDSDADGLAVVSNGLSLCKLHHHAYDTHLLGINERMQVSIHPKLLRDSDGPMLRHGLQEMHGVRAQSPDALKNRPDPDRLRERFREFQDFTL